MKKLFYPRLALTNLKKHSKTFVPYIMASSFTISMFYILHSITLNKDILLLSGGESLKMMLSFGVVVVLIFACIFIFYINSFLIKQRKKEMGLYNILGMEKKHIIRMLFFENSYVTLLCISAGLIFGTIFSKLLFLILLKLAGTTIIIDFQLSIPSMIYTIVYFTIIFLIVFIFNVFQISISNPITLLHGGNIGEKEPKTKLILTIFGVACLGTAYYLAQSITNPIVAFSLFFIAVILVIIGTYALFIAGSIAILKILKRNKNFYYQTKHFTVVSGMMYRMKQNAVGLANICVLCTCILVMLASTISLYLGMQDMLDKSFVYDIISRTNNITPTKREAIRETYQDLVDQYNVNTTDFHDYSYSYMLTKKEGNAFHISNTNDITMYTNIFMISIEEYNQLEKTNISLKDDEVLVNTIRGDKLTGNKVLLAQKTYTIKEEVSANSITLDDNELTDIYMLVVSNTSIMEDSYQYYNNSTDGAISYKFECNLDMQNDNDRNFVNALKDELANKELSFSVRNKDIVSSEYKGIYGGFLFIGIFLGIQFLIATALIIYYKQISEGYDDKNRYEIMQKVGMSNQEIRNSIHFQVLSVFFLPLILAVIHYAFAFKMITKLLALFQLSNVNLFLWCSVATIAIFIVFYSIVYFFTSKAYYKIVKK